MAPIRDLKPSFGDYQRVPEWLKFSLRGQKSKAISLGPAERRVQTKLNDAEVTCKLFNSFLAYQRRYSRLIMQGSAEEISTRDVRD